MAWPTAMDEKPCECIVRNILIERCLATLHRRLCETGSFDVHKPDTGRQRTTRTVFAEESVLQELERNPSTSTRVVSRHTHISQPTVLRILHDEGLHPFHLQRVQALEPEDYNKRMEFARWFLQENAADRNFTASVLFTDEATFSLEGVMNVHNLHTWAAENPHATRTHASQRKFTLNVWAGIVGDCLLGPYILPEGLDGCIYLAFLKEVLPDMLNAVPMPIRRRIRFQHDGSPAHFSRRVGTHLQATFPGPGLVAVDQSHDHHDHQICLQLIFSSEVFEKDLCMKHLFHHRKTLGRIVVAAGCVRDTPGIFEKVRRSMQRRCQACLDASGKNFEYLL